MGVLERITSLEQAAFSESTIELRSQVEQVRVDCDEDLLRQVLLNLVKNAVEASGASEAKVRIQLRTQVNNYSVEVHDEGPGISDDLKAGIFEAYFTTKHSGPAPGMGLGLAICQKIILDHNGRIELDSQPGHTVFALILPYRIAEAE